MNDSVMVVECTGACDPGRTIRVSGAAASGDGEEGLRPLVALQNNVALSIADSLGYRIEPTGRMPDSWDIALDKPVTALSTTHPNSPDAKAKRVALAAETRGFDMSAVKTLANLGKVLLPRDDSMTKESFFAPAKRIDGSYWGEEAAAQDIKRQWRRMYYGADVSKFTPDNELTVAKRRIAELENELRRTRGINEAAAGAIFTLAERRSKSWEHLPDPSTDGVPIVRPEPRNPIDGALRVPVADPRRIGFRQRLA
jgi:hypothetical protein